MLVGICSGHTGNDHDVHGSDRSEMAVEKIVRLFASPLGLLMKLPMWDQPEGQDVFDDTAVWETPDDFKPGYKPAVEPSENKDKLLNDVAQEEKV